MHELLDQQMAARIKAECRDESPLARFQRGVWILAELLDGLGFPRTAKAFQRLRAAAGDIPPDPPATEPAPLPPEMTPFQAMDSITTGPAASPEPLPPEPKRSVPSRAKPRSNR